MTCAPTQDEFLKPLKVVNGSYAPCGAGGEEHSGGRPDLKHKFLMPCPFTGPKMFWAGPNFLS